MNPEALPLDPGVYLFKDSEGKTIYVGKAKSLKKRVASYFNQSQKSPKTMVLVRHIKDVEFIVVDNEVEALLLENKLIKQYQPKYNITLKDAKTYASLKITDEPYPRLVTTRDMKGKGEFFGPFTDGFARRELQMLAIQLCKLRTCKKLPKRACLNYHIGTCTAPCEQRVSKEEYQTQVAKARSLLKGDTQELEQDLSAQMREASKVDKFEQALEFKRQLGSLALINQRQKVDLLKSYDQDVIVLEKGAKRVIAQVFSVKRGVISGKETYHLEDEENLFISFLKAYYTKKKPPYEIVVSESCWESEEEKSVLESYFSKLRGASVHLTLPQRGEKLELVSLAKKNAALEAGDIVLQALQDALNLPELPVVIECFDISHLSGTGVVAGMTRWVARKPDKSGYRRFEIKSSAGHNNDFQAMREVVYRRYKRLIEEGHKFPGLIIIDGGKGQLNAAMSSLRKLGAQIPIIALAKRLEEIYLPDEETPRLYDSNAEMMLYLRKIRDSVHNFAVSYQRKKRKLE